MTKCRRCTMPPECNRIETSTPAEALTKCVLPGFICFPWTRRAAPGPNGEKFVGSTRWFVTFFRIRTKGSFRMLICETGKYYISGAWRNMVWKIRVMVFIFLRVLLSLVTKVISVLFTRLYGIMRRWNFMVKRNNFFLQWAVCERRLEFILINVAPCTPVMVEACDFFIFLRIKI